MFCLCPSFILLNTAVKAKAIAVPLLASPPSAGWPLGCWAGRKSCAPPEGQKAALPFAVGSLHLSTIFNHSLPNPFRLWEMELLSCVSFPERASKHGFTLVFREEEEGHWEVMTCLGLHRMSVPGLDQGPTLWTVNNTSTFIHQAILPSSTLKNWNNSRKEKKKSLHLQNFLTFHWWSFSFPFFF